MHKTMSEMILKIINPSGVQVECNVSKVFLPGSAGAFEVLHNHAPIVSMLGKGLVKYEDSEGQMNEYAVKAGFVKVKENIITVCCE